MARPGAMRMPGAVECLVQESKALWRLVLKPQVWATELWSDGKKGPDICFLYNTPVLHHSRAASHSYQG